MKQAQKKNTAKYSTAAIVVLLSTRQEQEDRTLTPLQKPQRKYGKKKERTSFARVLHQPLDNRIQVRFLFGADSIARHLTRVYAFQVHGINQLVDR